MAVTRVQLIEGRESAEDERGRYARRVYHVECSSSTDGEIVARTATGIPRVFDLHPEDTSIWAVRVRATEQPTTQGRLWEVEVEYESPGYAGFGSAPSGNQDGTPENPNPLLRPAKISFTFAQTQQPFKFAKYYGLIKLRNDGLIDYSGLLPPTSDQVRIRPAASSAYEHFAPAPVYETGVPVLIVTRNVATWTAMQSLARFNRINSSQWFGVPVFCARIANISSTNLTEAVRQPDDTTVLVNYWEITYEIHLKEDGWYVDILDEGTRELIQDANGRWRHRPILDEDTMSQKQTPTQLDGNGRILELKDPVQFPAAAQAYYLSFVPYQLADFNALGIF